MTLLTNDAELHALEPEWADLWSRSSATPFQHPAWLLPWWDVFGTAFPRVAIVREGGRLDGVLPLYELPDKILPIGAGITDYQDALLDPSANATEALLENAVQGAALPLHLIDLPPWSALRNAVLPGWQGEAVAADPCPVLDPLRASAGQLRKLRMSRHRADRVGGWTVEVATTDTVVAMLDVLIELHTARWRGEGVLADPAVRAFHRLALPRLLEAGLLWLCALRIGDAIAAVIYALRDPERVLFYLSGHDDARAFESPGTLLLGWMLEHAGGRTAHFLRGAEGYKYAWGATDACNAQRIMMRVWRAP